MLRYECNADFKIRNRGLLQGLYDGFRYHPETVQTSNQVEIIKKLRNVINEKV